MRETLSTFAIGIVCVYGIIALLRRDFIVGVVLLACVAFSLIVNEIAEASKVSGDDK
jgi:hypothetical protein